MKKILVILAAFAAFSASADEEEFGLEELHQAAKVGIAHHLEESGKAASSVKSYAVGKRGHVAVLKIFFEDNSRATLTCHFHHEDGNLEEIDCH